MSDQQFNLIKSRIEQITDLLHNTDPQSLNNLDTELLKMYLLQAYEALTNLPAAIPATATNVQLKAEKKIPEQMTAPHPEPEPAPEPQPLHAVEKQHFTIDKVPVAEMAENHRTPEPSPQPVAIATAPEKPLPQTSLFDMLSSRSGPDNSMVEKMKKKSISNLKSAIGINEKYIFLYELFEGNISEYNRLIDYINQCQGKTEAFDFIDKELRAKYDWAKNPKAESMFLEIIERRFS